MVKKIFTFDLDIRKAKSTPAPILVEGDNGNEFIITLTDSGEPVDLTNCRVLLLFSQPSGRTAQQDNAGNGITMSVDAVNKFTVKVYTTSFSPGLNNCEVQVLSGDNFDTLVTSAQFNFTCRRSILNEDTIQATDEYPILVGLIDRVTEVEKALEPIEQNESARQTAEAARLANESGRVSAETARAAAEDDRKGAETARKNAENARVTAEQERANAESGRASAEAAREAAETARETKWNNVSATATTIEAESPATAKAEISGSGVKFTFGIPRGEKGDKGDKGEKGDPGDNSQIQADYDQSNESAQDYIKNRPCYRTKTQVPTELYGYHFEFTDGVNTTDFKGSLDVGALWSTGDTVIVTLDSVDYLFTANGSDLVPMDENTPISVTRESSRVITFTIPSETGTTNHIISISRIEISYKTLDMSYLPIKAINSVQLCYRNSNWTDGIRTVNVEGVTSDNIIIVTPDPESYSAWTTSNIRCTAQGEGTLTFACDNLPADKTYVRFNVMIVG